jgi:Bacterial EndoU nuclease
LDEVAAPVARLLDRFDEIAKNAKIDTGHILAGELRLNPDGSVKKAVGFHLREGGKDLATARVTQITDPPNAAGVYKAKVEIQNPADGTWVAKSAKSSFFPNHMKPNDVEAAIRHAYADALRNGKVLDDKFTGTTGLGFDIRGIVENNRIVTAFPVY